MSTFQSKFATQTELNKAIESIGRRGAKLDADIQDAALSCLDRVQQHGDVGFICRLFQAMPKGARRNALAEWAAKYGKVKINLDKSSNKEHPFLYWKEGNTDYEGAQSEPWYDCKPEKPLDQEFDFASKLQALLRSAKAARDAGKPVKGADVLDRLLNLDAQPVTMALPAEEPADV